jgi:hypothetical protein
MAVSDQPVCQRQPEIATAHHSIREASYSYTPDADEMLGASESEPLI